ncbi:Short-chain dehydrogenase/reductase family protein [Mycena indigotica]|uniref:Short-chain dehydrogenase/reductase family protein n=1 Tax=Mycena indigotica TaxID=2126181 RepID=A0A8H6S6N0_9AGAR|nr:Short-chain dehydrogenase/reductase family protein [Mycena indigotica]KAF7293066.1 Short-chain dehydrogenase/reductase family protein [Mycena indigotica]
MTSSLRLDSLRKRQALVLGRLRKKREEFAKLEQEVDDIQWELEEYKYPVLTLPKEIISRIFTHFRSARRAPLLGRYSPLVLAQICHHWREIALNTRTLWSSFIITLLPHKSSTASMSTLKIVNLFLERSDPVPLSFALVCEGKHDSPYVYMVMELLASHSSRWQHVSLCMHPMPHLNAIDGPMPLLHSLTVVSRKNNGAMIRFPDVPKLSFDRDSYTDIIPWYQLTVMNLESIELRQFVTVLRNCQLLVHCRATIAPVKTSHEDEVYFKALPIIHLPHLQAFLLLRWKYHLAERFTLSLDSYGNLALLKLRLPALQLLEVPECMLGNEPINALAALIARSGCALQELCIRDGGRTLMEPYEDAFPNISKIFFGTMDMTGRGVFEDDSEEWADGTESEDD